MELKGAVDKIMGEDNVSGLVWHDARGLLLAVEGDLAGAGHQGLGGLASLAARAEILSRDNRAAPVIRLDTTKRAVLVQRQSDQSVLAVSTPKSGEP
ncbi:hypothetical protein ACHHYP_07948 [Achlya hypogyna]|uniref:Uncharacterized protein n=1 Tax=Achlya hypogyna TaxID=1202772 RepID=A0A1V9YQ91_ACHHY|nr:hypothetical protein ACHHYP_07948 [Achlya hypogyna]